MWILVSLGLAAALAAALWRLARDRQAARQLREALRRGQPFLREDVPGAHGAAWDDLGAAANDLITEVRRLRQQRTGQLTQLEATLGSLQEAVLVVDSTNRVMLANRALHAIFPRLRQVLDHRLEVVLHSVTFLEYLEAVRRGEAAPQQQIEFVGQGESRWLEVTGTSIPPLHGTAGPWLLFVLHDITKQKRLELVRKEFVANVSHELRTPLSVIKGCVETLEEEHERMAIADRARFLRTVHRHTERLNSLLEDLLTLSRLESTNPGLRPEPIDLAAFLRNVVEDYRARPAASAHELSCRLGEELGRPSADPLKLTQVFENLLDNALKYTRPGSSIVVEARRQGGEVVISVIDNGPGIPAEDLPHIFERFYRVDKGRSREKGGTGLGLSIVKHIVQLHGGRVWAESVLGEGTTFFLTLPFAPAAAA